MFNKLQFLLNKLLPQRRAIAKTELEKIRHYFTHSWDGVTLESTLKYGWDETRLKLAEASANSDWKAVKNLINSGANPNDYQVDQSSWNTALHHAAKSGAPVKVIKILLQAGAWRSLPNRQGLRAIDLARQYEHKHLYKILEPEFIHTVTQQDLSLLQEHLNQYFEERSYIEEYQLRIPAISILFELEDAHLNFTIPGMSGFISLTLSSDAASAKIFLESICRVVGGPVPRWELSSAGCLRVASIRDL